MPSGFVLGSVCLHDSPHNTFYSCTGGTVVSCLASSHCCGQFHNCSILQSSGGLLTQFVRLPIPDDAWPALLLLLQLGVREWHEMHSGACPGCNSGQEPFPSPGVRRHKGNLARCNPLRSSLCQESQLLAALVTRFLLVFLGFHMPNPPTPS